MSWTFEHAPTTEGTDQLVLLAIADHVDDEGYCYPSIERLSRFTRLSERTVIRSQKNLIRLGVIEVVRGGHVVRGRIVRSNLYRFRMKKRWHEGDTQSPSPQDLALLEGDSLSPSPQDLALLEGDTQSNQGCQPVTHEGDTQSPDPSVEPSLDPSVEPSASTAQTPRFREQAKEPNGTNYQPIAKLVRTLLESDTELARADRYAELVEIAKQRCADLQIDYGRNEAVPFNVVHSACASELMKFRLFGGRPTGAQQQQEGGGRGGGLVSLDALPSAGGRIRTISIGTGVPSVDGWRGPGCKSDPS